MLEELRSLLNKVLDGVEEVVSSLDFKYLESFVVIHTGRFAYIPSGNHHHGIFLKPQNNKINEDTEMVGVITEDTSECANHGII